MCPIRILTAKRSTKTSQFISDLARLLHGTFGPLRVWNQNSSSTLIQLLSASGDSVPSISHVNYFEFFFFFLSPPLSQIEGCFRSSDCIIAGWEQQLVRCETAWGHRLPCWTASGGTCTCPQSSISSQLTFPPGMRPAWILNDHLSCIIRNGLIRTQESFGRLHWSPLFFAFAILSAFIIIVKPQQ